MNKTYSYTIRLLAFFLCCFISLWLYFLFTPAVSEEKGFVYYARPGITKHQVISELTQQGIITHSFVLLLYTFPQKNSVVKVGEYHFSKGSSPYSIWKQ